MFQIDQILSVQWSQLDSKLYLSFRLLLFPNIADTGVSFTVNIYVAKKVMPAYVEWFSVFI